MDQYDMGSDSEEMISVKSAEIVCSDDSSSSSDVKICTDCGTTTTPLWRGGPAGPKSLCNACGIRSRKKRRALLGLNKNDQKAVATAAAAASRRNNKRCGGESSGKDIGVKRSTVQKLRIKMKMKMGEVEQAAVLLMALSCGSFYA